MCNVDRSRAECSLKSICAFRQVVKTCLILGSVGYLFKHWKYPTKEADKCSGKPSWHMSRLGSLADSNSYADQRPGFGGILLHVQVMGIINRGRSRKSRLRSGCHGSGRSEGTEDDASRIVQKKGIGKMVDHGQNTRPDGSCVQHYSSRKKQRRSRLPSDEGDQERTELYRLTAHLTKESDRENGWSR